MKSATPHQKSKVSMSWKKLFNKLRSMTPHQNSEDATPHQKSKDSNCEVPSPDCSDTSSHAKMLINKIDACLFTITQESHDLQEYCTQLNSRLDLGKLRKFYDEIKGLGEDEMVKQLENFRIKLMKLMIMTPSKHKIGADKDWNDMKLPLSNKLERIISRGPSKNMPQLHENAVFETSMEFKDFEDRYSELHDRVKLCLLCFSIFPQGAVIKKRLMLQWWVTEGYAKTEEGAVDYFQELMDRGFIEPANDNRSPSVGSCRLHPFHRSALIVLAKRAKFFNFESSGEPSLNFSGSFQACLTREADYNEHDQSKKGVTLKDLEKLHLLLNLSDQTLESIDEWLPKMTNLNFLYLGRWIASATHHIVLNQESKLLNRVGKMKFVKFLSLQGVSNIVSLPHWVLQLKNLEVLDLSSCLSLESIPEKIYKLRRLTHLDMSDCVALAHMPKGLSRLTELKVLKGFFISKYQFGVCELCDLQNLRKLEKLCIYTDLLDFPLDGHIMDLEKLERLTKLTIAWGVRENYFKKYQFMKPSLPSGELPPPSKLPPKLEKLYLKSFPKTDAPNWLKPENLQGLQKLYINRGRLDDLGQHHQGTDYEAKWNVKELRLKYLDKMEMDWMQLQRLFPKLKYMEKVRCPKLTFFPFEWGWINPE